MLVISDAYAFYFQSPLSKPTHTDLSPSFLSKSCYARFLKSFDMTNSFVTAAITNYYIRPLYAMSSLIICTHFTEKERDLLSSKRDLS